MVYPEILFTLVMVVSTLFYFPPPAIGAHKHIHKLLWAMYVQAKAQLLT